MDTFFTIIIPNWNSKKYLKKALRSISEQTCRDFEVVVVDNGSDDGSVHFVRDNYPDIEVIAFEENKGFSKAINAGIRKAKGEFILFCDSDAVLHPSLLKEFKKATGEYPEYSCFTPKILSAENHSVIDSIGNEMCINGHGYRIGHNKKDAPEFNSRREVFGGSTVVLYEHSLFDDVGGLDEDFFVFYEDVEFNLRAQMFGYKYLYIPDAVAYHHGHGSVGDLPEFVEYVHKRNMLYLLIRDMPTKLLLRYFRHMVVYHLWKAVKNLVKCVTRYGCNQSARTHLRATFSAIKNMPLMLRKRKEVQRRRRVSIAYLDSILSDVR